jgi:DNA mismatch repair ATPase MutL
MDVSTDAELIATAVAIPSHVAIATELLFNAIDGGAGSISLTFDLFRNQIRCRDNGQGIAPHQFPHILGQNHVEQSADKHFCRNSRTLSRIADLAEIVILTRTATDEVSRRMCTGSSQYIAPFFAPGTEVVVSSIFESIPVRRQQMATAAWKREETQKLRTIANTVLLKFPSISAALIVGSSRVDLPACSSLEDRWKQVSGTQLRIDSDGFMTHFRGSSVLPFTAFLVNCFPLSTLRMSGRDVPPVPSAVTLLKGDLQDLRWDSYGLSGDLFERPAEPSLTFSVGHDELSQMKLIGLMSAKFILAHVGNIVYAIDQHAAHERVLLDSILASLRDFVKTRELKTPLKVTAGPVLTASLQEELRKWGWNVVQLGNSWQLFSLPLVDGTVVDGVDGLIEFVSEIERGVRRDIPGCIMHTLQTRACKRAIKFGDVIGDERAQELIVQLSKCRIPNHCAHGRTVAAPIYDLTNPFTQFARVQQQFQSVRRA